MFSASPDPTIAPSNHVKVHLILAAVNVCVLHVSSLTLQTPPIFSTNIILQSPPHRRNNMADYSIGDRVEVRWQAELFDAEVIHVHSAGKVDVVYDFDGRIECR